MTARRKDFDSGDGKPTSRAAPEEARHEWEFKARFRRHAFGWRSLPAITRIRLAVAEIKKVVRMDPMLAAEGAIAFLARVSPAIEHVDGSSGSIGTAINNAIAELVPIIAGAPAQRGARRSILPPRVPAIRTRSARAAEDRPERPLPVWQRQEVQAVLPAMTARRKDSDSGDGKPTSRAAPEEARHEWEFKDRFRRHAFGWRSQPAITRIRLAVAEIKKVVRMDPMLAAEGAIAFLARVSPAIEHVDGSSGSIGTAVNNAITELVPIIAGAPADAQTRDAWLERLWEAYQDDEMPYIESLGDYWGELCGSKEMASTWADRLIDSVKRAWSPDPSLRGVFKGTANCLSALVAAERHDDVLALLELAPYKMWHYRQYGVRALSAKGKKAEAIRYAEEGRGLNDSPVAIARVRGGAPLLGTHR